MRFITAENPVSTKININGKVEVVAVENSEVPQVESIEEMTTFCGGADNHLSWDNSNLETAAKNVGRAVLRSMPENPTPEQVEEYKEKARKAMRDYVPQVAATKEPSVKAKAQRADTVIAALESGKELTREELLAMLKAAK